MRKTLTLVFMCIATFRLQAQITINSTDIPLPKLLYKLDYFDFSDIPSEGINKTWDYSNLTFLFSGNSEYALVTDTFFKNRGADIIYQTSKNCGYTDIGIFSNDLDEMWDFNLNGHFNIGYYIGGGAIAMKDYGGKQFDSMGSDDIRHVLNPPITLLKYPITMNSSWSSVSTMPINMWITLNDFGLQHVPFQQKVTFYRKDSIVGWGKFIAYTPTGPSKSYDVLMRKTSLYSIDSFFINGSPDSLKVLDSLYLRQGEKNTEQYFYDFLRKGDFKFLMRFSFLDSAFSAPVSFGLNKEDLEVSIDGNKRAVNSALIFPNPNEAGKVSIQFLGAERTFLTYTITDITGKIVQNGQILPEGGNMVTIDIQSEIANGNYILNFYNSDSIFLFSDKLHIVR